MENTERRFLSVTDIQKILGVGQAKAYELMKSKEFPVIRLGGIYRVDEKDFEQWLAKKKSGEEGE